MTVGQIAYKVAKYLNNSRAALIDDAGYDLVINAMNLARLDAEKFHDFRKQEAEVGLSISSTSGASMTSAVLIGADGYTFSTTAASVKSVVLMQLQDEFNTQVWWPLLLDSQRLLGIKSKEQNYKYRGYPNPYGMFLDTPLSRFATDPRNLWPSRPLRAYWIGDRIYIDPALSAARNVKVSVNLWMSDYLLNTNVFVTTSNTTSTSVTLTATAPSDLVIGTTFLGRLVTAVSGTAVTLAGNANVTIAVSTSKPYSNLVGFVNNEDYTDWLTTYGADYLFWSSLVYINYFTNTYVPKADGYNSPPERLAANALQKLVLWDDYSFEQARQPMFIR